jgi:hypothetical protein
VKMVPANSALACVGFMRGSGPRGNGPRRETVIAYTTVLERACAGILPANAKARGAVLPAPGTSMDGSNTLSSILACCHEGVSFSCRVTAQSRLLRRPASALGPHRAKRAHAMRQGVARIDTPSPDGRQASRPSVECTA